MKTHKHPAPAEQNPEISPGTRLLAWCGWQMRVPANWQPVKIEGSFIKGTMFVGDGTGPYLMLRWWRPLLEGDKNFSIDTWLAHRFKKLHARPQPGAPVPAGFDCAAWVRDLETREKHLRTFWYGYQAAAETVLEVLMTSLTPEPIRDLVEKELLPSLELAGKTEPIPWSVFSASFISPPGFMLDAHHLMSGDIALRLVSGRERLILRTVYPADLALLRRKLPFWLDNSAFLERRKNRKTSTTDWRSSSVGLNGLQRTGWKRLPVPLGWVKPLYYIGIAAVDQEYDRLVLVDHRAPGPMNCGLAQKAAEQMNWDVKQ